MNVLVDTSVWVGHFKIPECKYCAVGISLFGQRADCFAVFRGAVGEPETDFFTRDVLNPPPGMPESGYSSWQKNSGTWFRPLEVTHQ